MLIRWVGILLVTAGFAGGVSARDKLTTLPPAVKLSELRHALVVGNASYTHGALKNPVNDARAMARVLSEAGFEVTLLEDATQPVMQRAIRRFGDSLQRGGVGLFYYAGHGMQVKGRNFLVPVNAEIDREYEVEFNSVDVNQVLKMMDEARNPLNIIILDACRNNPFARSFRVQSSGLAPMDAPSGTFIAFATAPGAVASDGSGDNGIYTQHLLAHLGKPGLPIEQLFKQVRIGVMRETSDSQTPWESSSLRGDFMFVPGAATDVAALVEEALQRDRERQRVETERLIEEALERQRRQLEAQGLQPVPVPPALQPEPLSPVQPPSTPPVAAPANLQLPQAADRWVYRLKPLRSKGERRYVVEVIAASNSGVLDRVSIDGGEWSEWVHSRGGYLVIQGVSLFSPYLPQFGELRPGRTIPAIALRDQAACAGSYSCAAKGHVEGRESLITAAGRFDTIKVTIEQEWNPVQPRSSFSADLWGRRTITVWYAPEVKRAVRYSSRVTAGTAPMEANFDLELLSYHFSGG